MGNNNFVLVDSLRKNSTRFWVAQRFTAAITSLFAMMALAAEVVTA
jgi:hypothetical protein